MGDTDSRQIALLIETSTDWGRGLIEGAAIYSRQKKRGWTLYFEPLGVREVPSIPDNLQIDGLIARVTTKEFADKLVASEIPCVNVSWHRYRKDAIAQCSSDEVSAGNMAARYFCELGFRNFAYYGPQRGRVYKDRFGSAYEDYLKSKGHSCLRFVPKANRSEKHRFSPSPELCKWLMRLPKPCAILTFHCWQGRELVFGCRQLQLDIPRDIAIIGGEYDSLASEICEPPLSTLDFSTTKIGYQAAQVLDKLMSGQEVHLPPAIEPSRVLVRQSTDTVAVDDDLIAAVVRFVNKNFRDDINTASILDQVPLSRRTLEIGLKRHLGLSPAQLVRRVRVDAAANFLLDTAWTEARIAEACGFNSVESMIRAFKKLKRSTPSNFRKQNRKMR